MFFAGLGCVSAALGAVGAVLPILPTVPFLLLAAYCFARSSERLHRWFTGTRLYRENLESYVQGRGMTRAAKARLLLTLTLLLGGGFVMMHRVPVGQAVLGAVWAFHVLYFGFGVRTIPPEEAADEPK